MHIKLIIGLLTLAFAAAQVYPGPLSGYPFAGYSSGQQLAYVPGNNFAQGFGFQAPGATPYSVGYFQNPYAVQPQNNIQVPVGVQPQAYSQGSYYQPIPVPVAYPPGSVFPNANPSVDSYYGVGRLWPKHAVNPAGTPIPVTARPDVAYYPVASTPSPIAYQTAANSYANAPVPVSAPVQNQSPLSASVAVSSRNSFTPEVKQTIPVPVSSPSPYVASYQSTASPFVANNYYQQSTPAPYATYQQPSGFPAPSSFARYQQSAISPYSAYQSTVAPYVAQQSNGASYVNYQQQTASPSVAYYQQPTAAPAVSYYQQPTSAPSVSYYQQPTASPSVGYYQQSTAAPSVSYYQQSTAAPSVGYYQQSTPAPSVEYYQQPASNYTGSQASYQYSTASPVSSYSQTLEDYQQQPVQVGHTSVSQTPKPASYSVPAPSTKTLSLTKTPAVTVFPQPVVASRSSFSNTPISVSTVKPTVIRTEVTTPIPAVSPQYLSQTSYSYPGAYNAAYVNPYVGYTSAYPQAYYPSSTVSPFSPSTSVSRVTVNGFGTNYSYKK